jgi:pyrroline-5-carboxylate reductase
MTQQALLDTKVGFIGFGNMGSAIAKGLVRAGMPGGNVNACAKSWDKLVANAAKLGANAFRDARGVAEASEVVFVAVKPNLVATVCAPLSDALAEKIVVSVAWGVTLDDYASILREGTACVATIPNLPVRVCEGAWLIDEHDTLSESQRELVDKLLGSTGTLTRLPSRLMGAAGTLTSCAPAYAAMFIEALADAGVKHGLPRTQAYQLVEQMAGGTGKMLLDEGAIPAALKDEVCSPGGATIRGVAQLEREGMRAAAIDAIDAVLGN